MSIRSVVLYLRAIGITIVLSQIVSAQGPNQFPHQVSLRTSGNSHICGGTIISATKIVAAAHCTNSVSIGSKLVDRAGNQYDIVNFSVSNDVAIMVPTPEISFGPSVQPITIGPVPPAGSSCVISWGSSTSATVLSAPVMTLANPICKTAFALLDTNAHLCGMTIGACVTDLGAPLVCGGTLVGINQSNGLCIPGLPRIYTRVSAYESWINSLN